MVERCTADDLRDRCLGRERDFAAAFSHQVTHGDERAACTMVAVTSEGEIGGVAHLAADPGRGGGAEFDLLVRSDLKRRGLGRGLLRALADEAAGAGLRSLRAEVLVGNGAMQRLAASLGFTARWHEGGVIRLELSLPPVGRRLSDPRPRFPRAEDRGAVTA